ncbi:MAG: hypothetical protein COA42_16425 [Alteromonadaceae bacterium]|nr:MAG: hypothetical protein COA42_16425 [Alteromonadaceae bacterium]
MKWTTAFTLLCCITFAGCSSIGPVEKDVSAEFNVVPQFQTYDQGKVAFYEQGEGEKSVVFMHGIPTYSYLWRNVMSEIANDKIKAVAFDLPGYGLSDAPKSGDYSYESLYSISAQWLDARPEERFTLVVTDLGSLIGLQWAMKNPHRVEAIVLLEAAFMPADDFLSEATFIQKRMFSMMKYNWISNYMMLNKPRMQSMALDMFTSRKITKQEKQHYLKPYESKDKREVLRYGPGPASMIKSFKRIDGRGLAATMDRNALALTQSDIPILLLKADPGALVRKAAIDYAKENLKKLTIKDIGAGIHFVAEDQPTAIAAAISDWLMASPNEQANHTSE